MGGQAVSTVGSRLAGFALVWWLTSTTRSATVLAVGTLCEVLPAVVLGPFLGALVDRWNRRWVMILADAAVALLSLGLALVSWRGQLAIWHVYVILFARAAGGMLHWTAMSASTPLMVPHEHLARVAGLNQSLNGALGIIAPPVGALLFGVLSIHGIMAIDVATAVLAITPLLLVSIPQPTVDPPARPAGTTLLQDVRAGLVFVWGWPGLRAVILMAALVNLLLNPALALLPLVVEQHFGLGAPALAGLESAWGLGAVAGGLLLGVWGGFRRRILTSMLGLIGIGVSTIVFGMTPAHLYALAVAAMASLGVTNPIVNGPLMAVVQGTVPPEKLGRVNSLLHSLTSAVMPLGMALAGPLSDALDVRVWFLFGGAMCLVMGVCGLFIPAVVHLEDERTQPQAVPSDPRQARV
ncbi:MAG: MFS transporter [Chloroflexi bacterium]|nr:MFS transporter [Chloroflexota bacterium]